MNRRTASSRKALTFGREGLKRKVLKPALDQTTEEEVILLAYCPCMFKTIYKKYRIDQSLQRHWEALCFCLVHCGFCPRPEPNIIISFFRFARILNRFRWNLGEVITATSRLSLNDYILDENGSGTREQNTRENSNRRQLLWPRRQTFA